jgi:hypothetical protein
MAPVEKAIKKKTIKNVWLVRNSLGFPIQNSLEGSIENY